MLSAGTTPTSDGAIEDLRRKSIPLPDYLKRRGSSQTLPSPSGSRRDSEMIVSLNKLERRPAHRSSRTSVMADTDRLLEPTTPTLTRQRTLSTASHWSINPGKPARPWPCRPCGLLLGTSHVLVGCLLIIYDVSTNEISQTAFAISSGICFIVSGVLGLIASRRLDKGTILLFFLFSLTSMAMCIAMFVESVIEVNDLCYGGKNCNHLKSSVHVALLCFSLFEATISVVSLIVCFRSLRNAYRIDNPASPYSALVLGDLGNRDPFDDSRIVNQQKATKCTKDSNVMLQYLVAD